MKPREMKNKIKKRTEKIKIKIKRKEHYLISRKQSSKGDGETNQEGKKKKEKTPTKIVGCHACLHAAVREAESQREVSERVRGEAENRVRQRELELRLESLR